jgi:hypothetical protein
VPQGLGLPYLNHLLKSGIFRILFVGRFKGSIISNQFRGEPMRRKKKNKSQNVPATPLPPMPGMSLPPLPGQLPTPGMPLPPLQPAPAELPPAPLPVPQPLPAAPSVTAQVTPPSPAPLAAPTPEKEANEYGELWAKRSAKPLPQIYGAIDRLGSGEAGSLLDRYSDRFGHSLDRDIIVLRKKEREEALNDIRSEPVVELLDAEEPDRLAEVETELRSLKPQYEAAKAAQDKASLKTLVPQLEALMRERKELKGITSAPKPKKVTPIEATEESDETDETDETEYEMDEADELFTQFFGIVNDLLGDELPEDAIETFMASDGFELFKEVGADPSAVDDERRGVFFKIIDEQLGNMPDDSITAFVESGDFALYKQISEMYA